MFVDSFGYCWGSKIEGSLLILYIRLEVYYELFK